MFHSLSDAGLLGVVVEADPSQAQKAVTNAAATIKSVLGGSFTEAEFKKALFVHAMFLFKGLFSFIARLLGTKLR